MSELIDFFQGLFSTQLWPARWNCGYWSDFHGWMYIISDLMIWLAYFAIPVIILSYIYKKKYELKYTNTYILFASFILLCGSTHLLDASMFWTPMYRFNGLVRAITGVVSLFTVYHLIKILPDAFREKTSVVLEKEISKRIEVERRLAEANQGLQTFAYIASHDLQEPLRKINMYTEQLREVNETKFDEESNQWFQKVISSTARMERMIKDILSLSSITEEVHFNMVDLNQVVQDALSDLEVKISTSNAQVQFEQLHSVPGNHQYLVQLFSNLIGNSIKFSQRQPIITIKSAIEGSMIEIRVTDNGIGMRQEDTVKVFQAFQRLHPKSMYDGTGIGLAICKKIVEIHHGQITIESQLGAGTTFIIHLPLTKNEPKS